MSNRSKQEPEAVDVVIIGAGVAGLTAACELQKRGISYVILEAQDHIGGRCVTQNTARGTPYNPGAHWLHGGEKNHMAALITEWGLEVTDDAAKQVVSFLNDKRKQARLRDHLPDFKHNADVHAQPNGYRSLSRHSDRISRHAARGWAGVRNEDGADPLEIARDPYGDGGWQLNDGMGAIPRKLAESLAPERILLNRPIAHVENYHDKALVTEESGKQWRAKHVICTPSIAALEGIHFQPALDVMFGKRLSKLTMGNLVKLIIEVSPGFCKTHRDLHGDCVDFVNDAVKTLPEPSQIYLFPAGQPLVVAMFNADALTLDVEQLKGITLAKTDLMVELNGLRSHVVSEPILTDWHSNPYIAGGYSARLKHGSRSDPPTFQHISLAGEAWNTHAPGHVTGAWLSGKEIGRKVAQKLKTQRGRSGATVQDTDLPGR